MGRSLAPSPTARTWARGMSFWAAIVRRRCAFCWASMMEWVVSRAPVRVWVVGEVESWGGCGC